MRIIRVSIRNFRGIKEADLALPSHGVLIGDNNTGKSTVLEAIDLVLGPERLSRQPPIDEHDFYAGDYLGKEDEPSQVQVGVTVGSLSEEQRRYFHEHVEWWNETAEEVIAGPPPEQLDGSRIEPVLRLSFVGKYDPEEDNFEGKTFFNSPQAPDSEPALFRTKDKRLCGFLFLRTLRTGSRALSLERGSLLDVILRLQDQRFNMWEDILAQLRQIEVAEKDELGVAKILERVQESLRRYVPSEWATNPHIRVSDLTREHLRRTLTVFMGTGEAAPNGAEYSAPFHHQGTGTINTLILAMLSIIAELKQNVIFAMEEPEIAIPPHTQRRIVSGVRGMSAQSIFTSHSPYVLDEFEPKQVLLLRRDNGVLTGTPATLPPAVKAKAYREELRTRFCECLLARRVLIVEGRTEFDVMPVAARRLHELVPGVYKTFENLGIAVINAGGDTNVAPLGEYFRTLGKETFAITDRQEATAGTLIRSKIDHFYESSEDNFEKLILNQTAESALRRFAVSAVQDGRWPQHMAANTPNILMPIEDLKGVLRDFFKHSKGEGEAAQLISMCRISEMPDYLKATILAIKLRVEPPLPPPTPEVPSILPEITSE